MRRENGAGDNIPSTRPIVNSGLRRENGAVDIVPSPRPIVNSG